MSIRVIVNGASGKMGAIACETIQKNPAFTLVAALGRYDDLGDQITQHQAQIVIDLTLADCVYANALTIIEHHAHAVIGTSGLQHEQIQVLQQRCDQQQLGGIIVPNFSIGAVLMMHFSGIAARLLSEVEIVEIHHQQKLDAPSGTAIKTAELIAAARTTTPQQASTQTITLPGARGACYKDIPIHSLRLPGVLAKQHVIFGNTGETLTLAHESIDRHSFMPGLILACQRVQQLKSMYYGLEKLLDL